AGGPGRQRRGSKNHGRRGASVSTDRRSAEAGRTGRGAPIGRYRGTPRCAQPLLAAGGGSERRRQNRVDARGGQPSGHAGADGPRRRAGGSRKGHGPRSMKNRHYERSRWLVMITVVVTWGCGRHEANADAPSLKAVRLVAVESWTAASATTYSAVITPNVQVDLAFRVTGYVVDVRQTKGADGQSRALEPGAAIARGVTLARVRAADYQAVVDKAHGARDESSAGITAAEAGLAEAQAALTQAESDFGRVSILWQQESITKPVYDGARSKLDAARAKVDAAIAAIAAAKQRARAAAAQAHEAE